VAGTATLADGSSVTFDGEPAHGVAGADVPDETRSIVLNDGQQRGRSRNPGRVWVADPMAVPIDDGTSNT
jgi:hypothetical protein